MVSVSKGGQDLITILRNHPGFHMESRLEGNREGSRETVAVVQGGEDGGLDKGSSSGKLERSDGFWICSGIRASRTC